MKSLHTKKGRREKKMYLAEGVRLLEDARRHGAPVRRILHVPSRLSDRGLHLIEQFRDDGVEVIAVSDRDMSVISGTKTSPGVLAVCAMPRSDLTELRRSMPPRLLLCDNIADPGNLGTLMRSALAFGFGLVLLCGASADAYSPKVVRSSAGAVFGLVIGRCSAQEALSLVAEHGGQLVAADVQGTPMSAGQEKRLNHRRLALAVGSEASGLSQAIRERADCIIKLEHHRAVESLNAAVAGSIIMNRIYLASRR